MANILELTDSNFDTEVLQASQPVLVDFWAPWCGPCRMIAPMIEELASDNQGKAKIAKLNIDNNPASAQKYDIASIPTLLVFHNGEVVQRFNGPQPKSRLQEVLDSAQ